MGFADFYKKKVQDEEILLPAEQPQEEKKETAATQQPAGIPTEPTAQPNKSTVDMSWWQSPNYTQAEQALQQQAQATMQQQQRRAENERKVALLGDIARLGAQTWAKSGGAWMIPKTESQAAAANTRLQQLRDKHAADMLAYSQRLQQARLADKQDQMRKEQTRQAIAKEQAATAAAAQQQAFDNAVTMQKMQNEREANVAKMAIDVQKMQNDAVYRQGMVDAAKRRAEAYEQYVTNGGRKSTNKTLTFVSPDNERYDISENVYNASIGELYSMICEDLDIPTDQSGEIDASANKRLQRILGIEKSIMGGSRTETMKNVVSALWKDSPRAKEYLKLLSEASRQEQGQQADGKADIWDDTEDYTIELDNI